MTDLHWASAHGSSAMTPAMVSLGSSSAPPSGQRRGCSQISIPRQEKSDTAPRVARYHRRGPQNRGPGGGETLAPPPPPPPYPPPPPGETPPPPAFGARTA